LRAAFAHDGLLVVTQPGTKPVVIPVRATPSETYTEASLPLALGGDGKALSVNFMKTGEGAGQNAEPAKCALYRLWFFD
ncbi:MAG: hypothetical protein ACREKE_02585, partial [bacterium]